MVQTGLDVLCVGFGRTGTKTMKLALQELGFSPCCHWYDIAGDMDRLVPLWEEAVAGRPDWPKIFEGFRSAADWPVVSFWRELAAFYPDAKLVLTTRSPESWVESFTQTSMTVLNGYDEPDHLRRIMAISRNTVFRDVGNDFSPEALAERFTAHEEEVKATIAPDRLLVFSPKDGWEPLCAFLGVPVPSSAFPRTNDRSEFFVNFDRYT